MVPSHPRWGHGQNDGSLVALGMCNDKRHTDKQGFMEYFCNDYLHVTL